MNQTQTGVDIPEQRSLETNERLQRKLRPRHLSMIAIGGTIGTGLFMASGATISTAGPGGALVSYLAIGIMVYFLMTSLGEMSTLMPTSGAFQTYATKFVDPALGFAVGWNYWYNYATGLPAELAAGALIMQYWFPHSPAILWSALFLVILFALNIFSAKGYAEGEYWFAGIKVIAILGFLVVGVLMILGIMGGHAVGFKNFAIGGTPFHGGFLAMLGIFIITGVSYQGVEMVGVISGEAEDPQRTVPKAINRVFWRILLFYVLAIFVIGLLVPYTDPNLLKSDVSDVAVSPFTLIFKRAGLAFAAALMNAVILTSVLSAGNSYLYGGSRMLWALAKQGQAPKLFAKVNSRGVPTNALYVTTIFGFLAFLTSLFGNGTVYIWLLSATGMAGFIAWIAIAICHYRFRKAYIVQGRDLNKLVYKAKWYPFGPIFALVLCLIVMFGQDYSAFIGPKIDWAGAFAAYIGIPIFLVLWLGYKFSRRTKVISLTECNFDYED